MLKLMRKAQSTAEYAIVIGLVIAAAVAMQVYVKRGIQAKVKDATDYIDPDAAGVLTGKPYEPNYLESEMDSTSETHQNAKTEYGGQVTRKIADSGDVSTRTGTQKVLAPTN
jgi:hypothetical protein